MSTQIIADHLAWSATPKGEQARVVEHQGDAWLAVWNPHDEHLALWAVTGDAAAEQPLVDYTSPIELPVAPEEAVPLLDELVRLGSVARLTNPSLWDAIVTAVLRQSTGQARQRHRSFYAAYGRGFVTSAGEFAIAPTPEVVLALSDDGFAAVGGTFSRAALRAAAEAYLEHGEQWAALVPESLAKELGEVPRISPWTAATAAADFTGDFSIYPVADLAVRTWACAAAPGLTLPSSDREFEALWRRWAPTRAQRHALTLFTLAYGSHRSQGRG
ncbi:hypothetical protein ACWGN5_34820 [Streptomyces sp. NPDC055815]